MEASKLVSCGPSLPRRATFLGGKNGEMKRGTPRHPKTYALAEALSIPLPHAVGILEMIWHHAAIHTPRGDIGALPDVAIAEACCFRRTQLLIDSLLLTHWLDPDPDYRLIIHDWPQHCENSVKKWLQRNEKDVLPVYGKCLDIDETLDRQCPPSREAKAKAKASKDLKEEKDGEILPPELDEQFLEYRRLFEIVGNPIPEDFAVGSFCWRAWCLLDFEQRTAVVESLEARRLTGAQVLHSADSYLSKREYKRALRKVATNGSLSRHERILKAMEEA